MASSGDVIYMILEVLIAVGCCAGNALVIWAVWMCGALKHATFCFIVSLAVADFLVGVVTVPVSMLVDIHVKTSFYSCLFMCCMVIVLQVASVAFLLAIAVDRCLRVCIPLRYKCTVTRKRSWMVVALCWIVSTVLGCIPMFGWHNSLDGTTNSLMECSFLTAMPMSFLVNLIFFGTLLPPLAVMIGLYFHIFLVAKKQLRANVGISTESSTFYQKESKLAASLALVLVLFAVCWLPLYLMHTVNFYSPKPIVSDKIVNIGVLLSHANSVVNPIVYAFKIPKIKKAYKKLWMSLSCGRKQQQAE
ncbi:adenosine receptor A1-like [Electrophorus electricus]|uniref:G-protein coupled receptors family 1 profile domain-containing protein n=2 Tax=Electrophorus TaxID=8004 RepID=A0AAY5EVT6_ELEEL|nr:adenosine receptor A1-like [Electrophorus electricus]